MNTAKTAIRLPLLPASLAAFLLLLSTALLLFSVFNESNRVRTGYTAMELKSTVDQLSEVVKTESSDWVQGDQLAQLVASADTQVDQLDQAGDGYLSIFWSDSKAASVRNVSADWKLVREGLLSFNQANDSQATVNQVSVDHVPVAESKRPSNQPTTTQSVQITVPADFPNQSAALAQSFEAIRVSIIEGTRLQSLIDLVESTAANWQQINSPDTRSLAELVTGQQDLADELLQLTGAGTDKALFGYYTSNQIVDYVQRIKAVTLLEQVVPTISDQPQQKAGEPTVEAAVAASAGESADNESSQSSQLSTLSNAFVSQALAPLQESVANLGSVVLAESDQGNLFKWLGLSGLLASLMLLLSAITKMSHVADILKMRPEQSLSPASVSLEPRAYRGEVRGAMSLREADQLIEHIDGMVDGDIPQLVKLPNNSHVKAIARSAARSATRSRAIVNDVVSKTREAAAKLNALIQRQDDHSRVLAALDIKRQTETAELSEGISARSALLEEQRGLLSSSGDILKELSQRSESAVNGANQVSASVAAVSAQVEIGIERLQRLIKTAGSVTQATTEIKQLAEKTRLQALNVSLKVPQAMAAQTNATTSATSGEYDAFSEFSAPGFAGRSAEDQTMPVFANGEDADSMFDDIHLLTGRLVQVSNEADLLIGALRKSIEETTLALRESTERISESAHHTHTTSLLGKELSGFSDQLRNTVDEAVNSLQTQQSELSQTAEKIIRLDKTGNDTSELTLALTQDIASLQALSSKLENSVSHLQVSGEASFE